MFFGVGAKAALLLTAAAYLGSNPISDVRPSMDPLKRRARDAPGLHTAHFLNGKALHLQGLPVADL
jgi:hypothetical protein